MNQPIFRKPPGEAVTHSGLKALCGVAAYYRIAVNPGHLVKELALGETEAGEKDLVRAARMIGLKARIIARPSRERVASAPTPAILRLKSGRYCLLAGETASGLFRVIDPIARIPREISIDQLLGEIEPVLILVARHFLGAGVDPRTFGFRWFPPSIWRYRKPLVHVLVASFLVQIFALVTPLFFQIVIDKVLTHRGYSTLFVLVGGLARSACSTWRCNICAPTPCRTRRTGSTSNSASACSAISRACRSPISRRGRPGRPWRVRELETIRAFLTGQGLFSALDFSSPLSSSRSCSPIR